MNGWVFCCILFVAATRSCYGLCQFPPELWCSSPEIIQTCQVSDQCSDWSCVSQADAKPIDVVIYYKSFCRKCSDFIDDHLDLAHKEIGEIMNLRFIPIGNTEERRVGERSKFTCAGGEEQCSLNLLQACAIELVKDMSLQFPLIECMMKTSSSPENIARSCASDVGIDGEEIISCSKGDLGYRLEQLMSTQTYAHRTTEDSYYPLVIVNGGYLYDSNEISEAEFLNTLCQTYKGPFPFGCRMSQSAPTHTCQKA
ncbi:hypothetical protein ACJMK2_004524 [Sinanodonta woodiana]|uniref:Gamma-interferon-inducible lysosomal thiol reductase n=1 Tax=Sinanodonta woodiana TaxID=1069815 RepID=A0ABD3Y1F2_SINWO